MPKRAVGLTARKVETTKAPGAYADGGGLYLQVATSGAKSWIFRYTFAGRRRDMGLGSVATIGLADARTRALEQRRLVMAGTDPIEAKRASKAALAASVVKLVTFKECAVAYIATMKAGWKNAKHAGQWTSTLETYAFPILGGVAIDAVDTQLVLRVIEPLWSKKTETASRLRGRIEAILDYAKTRGMRAGENPARWKGHLDQVLPTRGAVAKVEHHRSMAYEEMPNFWPRLQIQDGLSARALELCILTATRSGEVLGARWEEIDLDSGVWTIPSMRMKAGLEHRIPLSLVAVELLKKLAAIRMNEFVFPGQMPKRPLSGMAMTMVLRRMKAEATAHGFRATFRTWIADQTRYSHEVAEAALAHTIGDKVVVAYQRGDLFEKRRNLMDDWATFLEQGQSFKLLSIQRKN